MDHAGRPLHTNRENGSACGDEVCEMKVMGKEKSRLRKVKRQLYRLIDATQYMPDCGPMVAPSPLGHGGRMHQALVPRPDLP